MPQACLPGYSWFPLIGQVCDVNDYLVMSSQVLRRLKVEFPVFLYVVRNLVS